LSLLIERERRSLPLPRVLLFTSSFSAETSLFDQKGLPPLLPSEPAFGTVPWLLPPPSSS
jgi:hypothetical protein